MVVEKKKRNTYNNYESSIFMLFCFLCFVFIVESKSHYKLKQTILKNTDPSGGIAQVIDRFFDKNSDPSGIVPCHFLRPTSTDDKLSIPITQWRERHPTSYCVKFESFADMMNLIGDGKYESRRFTVGGYNWTFLIYPTGDKNVNVNNQVSVYAKIDNSSLITNPEDVHAEVKFFVYNRVQDRYWVYQETEALRFHLFNPQLGQPRFRATSMFTNPSQGYIFEGGQSVFGIDVFVAQPFKSWEVFSFVNNTNAVYTWDLTDFSNRYHEFYRSGWFVLEGKSWNLKVYPNGDGSGKGNSLSLYLLNGANEETYVKAKLRILDQIRDNNEEKEVEGWPTAKQNGWGFEKFISLADLKDESKGFIVNDVLRIQVEILAFTKTDFIN